MADAPSAPRSSGSADPRSSGHDDTVPAADSPDTDPPRVTERAHDAPRADERYQLGAEIGRGGMGRVVEAFDTQLGRTVALKEVLPSQSTSIAKRFQREVRITARLEHQSIVPLYDSGVTADGRPFYVMRRVSGRPLDQLITRARGLDERMVLLPNVLAAIDAIAHAHRRGVIHRDLKPGNILVGDLGETVVIDWGLAKVVGESEPPPHGVDAVEPVVPSAADSLQTQIGSVFGTPGFMAPEQARGDELGPGSDVYALGATLYQLLAGKPPVRGTSATEVIASTLQHEIVPLASVAPDAPAELATIIAKALAADATQRYADAGELAEDVRRFLTGQLVAAHRYTRRQRIARFARRHRAALVVAAAAATAVAALSWISVHRILTERDAATAARAEAEHQRNVADSKAAEARQRADQLLLAHARGLLDTSPTEAIAALERIHATSPQTIDEARAVAKAAVARGVAWGVPSLPGATTSFEMTRDGSRLLQVNRKGQLQVVDLERRKQLATIDIGVGTGAFWVAGDRSIFLDRDKQPPALYDPASGAIDPIALRALRDLDRTPDGRFVGYIDEQGNAGIIDIATRSVTPVWTKGSAERSVAIAHDGSWLAFGDRLDAKRARLVVVNRAGAVLAQRPGSAVVLGVSPGGKLAASLYEEVVELVPGEPIAKLPLDAKEAMLIHQLSYRGEVLQLVGARTVISFVGGRLVRSDALADTVYLATQAANGLLVVSANDSNVHLLRDGAHLVLPLTDAPEGMYRLAAGADSSRIAATARDAILIWDAATLFPQIVDSAPGMFIANRRVVVPEGPLSGWVLWDVDSGARTPITGSPDGVPLDYQGLVDEQRIAVLAQTPRGASIIVLRGDGSAEVAVDDIASGRMAIVPGNGIVYSLGKNRIFGKVGSEPSRELVSLDGEVRSLAANGTLGYAALSTTGELVRGTFGGADFARTRLDDLDKAAFVVADHERNVIVGTGNRLLRWRGDVHEMARFAVPIDYVSSTELGLYVALTNKEVFFVPANGNQTPQRVPIAQLSSISARGTTLAGLTATSQIELVDLPSLARWTLPKLFTAFPRVALSPDGALIQQSLGSRTALWRVAQPGSDFAAWLDELTNAALDDDGGHIRWPWQP